MPCLIILPWQSVNHMASEEGFTIRKKRGSITFNCFKGIVPQETIHVFSWTVGVSDKCFFKPVSKPLGSSGGLSSCGLWWVVGSFRTRVKIAGKCFIPIEDMMFHSSWVIPWLPKFQLAISNYDWPMTGWSKAPQNFQWQNEVMIIHTHTCIAHRRLTEMYIDVFLICETLSLKPKCHVFLCCMMLYFQMPNMRLANTFDFEQRMETWCCVFGTVQAVLGSKTLGDYHRLELLIHHGS